MKCHRVRIQRKKNNLFQHGSKFISDYTKTQLVYSIRVAKKGS